MDELRASYIGEVAGRHHDIEWARAKQMGAEARPRKPFPAPDEWVATLDEEEVNSPYDERRHDWLGTLGLRQRRP